MPRLVRHLLTAVSALSLLMCMATVALWVRSYWFEDRLIVWYGYRCVDFAAYRGEMGCEFVEYDPGGTDVRRVPRPVAKYVRQTVEDVRWRDEVEIADWQPRYRQLGYHDVLGFRFHVNVPGILGLDGAMRGVAVPAWFVALCTLMFPAWSAMKSRRQRVRVKQGFCAACGYDLRATPGRCPECGTIAENRICYNE